MFWKPNAANGKLSQWYASEIVERELPINMQTAVQPAIGTRFQNAEQRMMYMKALLFGDQQIANTILITTDPKKSKSLGRRVANFDQSIWESERQKIVESTNWLKFTQSQDLLDYLLSTGNSILVEASPTDRIWGIGFTESNAVNNQLNWGMNLLGLALMNVRAELRTS